VRDAHDEEKAAEAAFFFARRISKPRSMPVTHVIDVERQALPGSSPIRSAVFAALPFSRLCRHS